jgi:uncharacterized protein (TIGR02246 family)
MRPIFFIPTLLFFTQILNAQQNDSVGVIKAIEGFRVSLGKGDARAFADLFALDADFTNVVDSSIHGRENIYSHHVNVFKNRPSTRKNNVNSYRIRFLRPDIASVEIRWDNLHSMGADGTTLPDRDGVWISVMTKENGEWYFKVVRNVFLHDGTPGHQMKKTQ